MNNKRVVLTGYGGPNKLRLEQADIPVPAEGELLVRVEFAGVAFADVMQRHGQYPGAPNLPYTPGYDVVGLVEKSGPKTSTSAGTRIAALTQFGGYAQFVVVKEAGIAVVPETVPPHQAVCLVLNYISAYQMLHRVAKLKTGQSLLVHGAAGGVGTAALQLGKAMGLQLLGTASAPKQELVRQQGAIAIDYQHEDFVQVALQHHPEGLNAVLDPIGPKNWRRSKQILKRGGHLVAYGGVGLMNKSTDTFSGTTLSLVGAAVRQKLLSFGTKFTFYGVSVRNPNRTRTDLEAIMALAQQGQVDPVVSDILPLDQVAEAHRRLAAAEVRGKLVLDCQ